MENVKASTKWEWSRLGKTGALVLALLVAGMIGFLNAGSPAGAATGGSDDDGRLLLAVNQVISPGQVFNGNFPNLVRTRVYYVNPEAFAPTGCRMLTTREEFIVESDGELTLFWEVKNVGQTSCAFDVLLAFTS